MYGHIIPATFPAENTIYNDKRCFQKTASFEVLEYLKISPEETLGVGHTQGDWNFMSFCKYAGVVGNASQELKRLAKGKKARGNIFWIIC